MFHSWQDEPSTTETPPLVLVTRSFIFCISSRPEEMSFMLGSEPSEVLDDVDAEEPLACMPPHWNAAADIWLETFMTRPPMLTYMVSPIMVLSMVVLPPWLIFTCCLSGHIISVSISN